MKKGQKNLGGRPRKAEGDRLVMISTRYPPAMVEALDALIADRIKASGGMETPDRSELIRGFVRDGLRKKR